MGKPEHSLWWGADFNNLNVFLCALLKATGVYNNDHVCLLACWHTEACVLFFSLKKSNNCLWKKNLCKITTMLLCFFVFLWGSFCSFLHIASSLEKIQQTVFSREKYASELFSLVQALPEYYRPSNIRGEFILSVPIQYSETSIKPQWTSEPFSILIPLCVEWVRGRV